MILIEMQGIIICIISYTIYNFISTMYADIILFFDFNQIKYDVLFLYRVISF